jgi:hypothetical protein
MTNRFAAKCTSCSGRVAARAGVLSGSKRQGWSVRHADCSGEAAEPTWKQRYGRCEDAPCCGCCGVGDGSYWDGGY